MTPVEPLSTYASQLLLSTESRSVTCLVQSSISSKAF